MCNIYSILNNFYDKEIIRQNFYKGSSRGPEFSCCGHINDNVFMAFHRLAINGTGENFEKSNQPFSINNVHLICNGEIYNWKELYNIIGKDKQTTNSDCEVIIHLYKLFGIHETLQMLDGVFGFVLYDENTQEVYVARDLFGIRPLYTCFHTNNVGEKAISFASQAKQFDYMPKKSDNYIVEQHAPGCYSKFILSRHGRFVSNMMNVKFTGIKVDIDPKLYNVSLATKMIREKLTAAVKKRIDNTDRPICCLLSGGLDSSLIASIVKNYYKGDLHTWSIGLEGSEDLEKAQKVADFLGTKHHSITVTEKEFLSLIPQVIYQIESYDTTTVRASVGNYAISSYIRTNSDSKVIFNGDGSDELAGGYMYFHAAPSDYAFDRECKRLLKDIHFYDVLRSDRSISNNGLEARTPFLDKDFVRSYLSIPSSLRNHNNNNDLEDNNDHKNIEKWLLRKSFDCVIEEGNNAGSKYLPDEVLWRKKEAFSDGVSKATKSWFEIIQDYVTENIYGEDLVNSSTAFEKKIATNVLLSKKTFNINKNTPMTLEQLYYREVFNEYFPYGSNMIPYFWMPKFINATDASARTLDIYKKFQNKKI